jgi:PAS domain S-box-containing protein
MSPDGEKSSELPQHGVGGAVLAEHALGSLFAEVAVLDRAGRIVMTNDAWKRFARLNSPGRTRNLGVGANYLEVCRSASGQNAEGAKEVLNGLEEVLSGRRRDFSHEYSCHSPTDRRWLLLQAAAIGDPPNGAVLLHIDITSRKLLEERLHQQEQRFRIALANSPVVVFNQDRELRYTWINSPILGWAAQEYVGRTDAEIVGGEDGERLMTIKRAVLESGAPTRAEALITFQGKAHYFDLNVSPVRDTGGAVVGITCACTDITAMKRSVADRERLIEELAGARRELMVRNLDLEALNQERSQWLGMAAHDLRNPVSSILLNCELLAEELRATNGQSVEALDSIHDCGHFMLELLDDVLEISAMEAGIQRFVYNPTDLASLIDEAIALSRPIARHKAIDIEVGYPNGIPAVVLDRHKMTQVFLNLIGNAIKFSPNGGKIQVTVRDAPGDVHVSVRDYGPGIPADELVSIFVPFRRGRTMSLQPGTGLGLAICKRIVERHAGRIWAENGIDGGAVIHLSLPRQTP